MTIERQPSVSVLLPVLNGGPYLRTAIESVLAQTFEQWELVVVIQGHEPADEELVNSYDDPRIRVLRLPGEPGLATALDLGLQACRAEFVARFDADDVCEPHRLELQHGVLSARADVSLVGSAATLIDASGTVVGLRRVPVGSQRVRRHLMWRNCILHPSVMFRTEAVKAIGGYDAGMDRSEDYDLWLRLLSSSDVDNIREPLIRLRLHDGQLSRRYRISYDSLRALHRSRRTAAGERPAQQALVLVQDAAETVSWFRHRARAL